MYLMADGIVYLLVIGDTNLMGVLDLIGDLVGLIAFARLVLLIGDLLLL
jgi:hypothetical protein